MQINDAWCWMSLLVLLMFSYILMIWESGTSGHSRLWFVLFAKICLSRTHQASLCIHLMWGNETFLLMGFTRQHLKHLWTTKWTSNAARLITPVEFSPSWISFDLGDSALKCCCGLADFIIPVQRLCLRGSVANTGLPHPSFRSPVYTVPLALLIQNLTLRNISPFSISSSC